MNNLTAAEKKQLRGKEFGKAMMPMNQAAPAPMAAPVQAPPQKQKPIAMQKPMAKGAAVLKM